MFHLRVPSSGLLLVWGLLLFWCAGMRVAALAGEEPGTGLASWYGEEHRGKLMANGRRFDPDKLTAASWFYPLGTKVRVSLASTLEPRVSVVVTITDRGPAKRLVHDGRIIDLSHASFKRLGDPDIGLLEVIVTPIQSSLTLHKGRHLEAEFGLFALASSCRRKRLKVSPRVADPAMPKGSVSCVRTGNKRFMKSSRVNTGFGRHFDRSKIFYFFAEKMLSLA